MSRTLLTLVLIVLTGCGLGSDHDDDQEPTVPEESMSTQLACEEFASIHADLDPSFEGYATPEEALGSWSGLPDGEWTEHEDGAWILVNGDGGTVGRGEVRSFTSNASTTFASERYVSEGIEYCG